MGRHTPPSQTFLISDFVLQDTKNIFCQCIKIILSVVRIFHFGPCFYPKGSLVIAIVRHTIPGRFSWLVVTSAGEPL